MPRKRLPCVDTTPIRIALSLVLMSLLSACSVFGLRSAEEASYSLLQKQGPFELRHYEPMVVAETIVDTDFHDASGIAFGRLFAYISGDNNSTAEIAMTAPVMALDQNEDGGRSIAMTAPVTGQESSSGWRFAFVLPAGFTLNNAPAPINENVRLRALPARKVAVMRFSGLFKEAAFRDNLERLRGWMSENRLDGVSPPRIAGYDPPWTLPFLRRNEVMIDIDS